MDTSTNINNFKEMNTDIRNRFKKTNPQEEQKSKQSSGYLKPFKYGINKFEFQNGRTFIRLLPQPQESPFTAYCEYYVLQLAGGRLEGTIAIAPDCFDSKAGKLMASVGKALRSHGEAKYDLYSKENEAGVKINTRPRVAFLGYRPKESNPKLELLDLPGSYPAKDGDSQRPSAGNTIVKSITELDLNGDFQYGDIFDIDKGKPIALDVVNAKTMLASYTPIIQSKEMPVPENLYYLLDSVKPFDNYLDFYTADRLAVLLENYLPAAMVQIVQNILDSYKKSVDIPEVE